MDSSFRFYLYRRNQLANLIELWVSDDKKSGYIKYDNGFIEQWGFISFENTVIPKGYYTVNFYIAFITTPSHSIELYGNDNKMPNVQSFAGNKEIKLLFFEETHFLHTYHGIYWSARGIWK